MPDGPGGWGITTPDTTPISGGSGVGGILREFHVPWPACNQDAARQAADAWTALADELDDISTDCNNLVASITTNNSGTAIDAFAAKWQQYGGKTGSIPLTSQACRALAKACDEFADQVSEVKTEIEHKAEELAGAIAMAGIALIFSFGFSAVIAENAAEVVIGWVTDLMATLADQAANVSIELSDAIGFTGEVAASVAGSATEGFVAGSIRGGFAAMFGEAFATTLNAANGEPQPSAADDAAGVLKDIEAGGLLGVLAEAAPAAVDALLPRGAMNEAYAQALDFSPQLANSIMSSAKIADLLDTPAGKAFIAGGGITALNAKGILDETETTAKTVEDALEAALSQAAESGE
ncbi:hypothetical protein [Actinospica robiniae]|uniref:WXG100-like domain-containing protein n=1 Tax=Actinospica robiniae TaxID=304901 RepID=UPI0003F760B9|nr:hypothetical protein [Actinospica robiniae]